MNPIMFSSSLSLEKMMLTITIILLSTIIDLNFGQHMSSQNYRRQMNMMRQLAQKAYEHGIRINEDAQCSKPRPELIYLNDSKKIYLPRATLLHRCSDLTGCCPHATHSCQPSRVEKLTLYFFVIGVPKSSSTILRRNQNIEQLTFINHTECSCKPIDTMWSPEKSNTIDSMMMNDINDRNDSIEQFRNIRDPSSSNTIIDYRPIISMTNHHKKPTVVLQARNNNGNVDYHQNYYHHHHHQSQTHSNQHHSMYQETENILKYWAKIMGYNVDKSSSVNNNPHYKIQSPKKRTTTIISNGKPNKTRRVAPSSGHKSNYSPNDNQISSRSSVTFETPDVQYHYSTNHGTKNQLINLPSNYQQYSMDNLNSIQQISMDMPSNDQIVYYLTKNTGNDQQLTLNDDDDYDDGKIIYSLENY
ncbi:uncharacterized protein LOC113798161 [Dermatophagoides pteronyssinus]|uniref:Myb-like protein D n=2 Tax=Dermatophagoides pteronyssinus TaxID=6956 RepID=A0A6P6YG33_DERPT|nr:myb-like protein D [Dermatophagoides pteronyssinus]